MTDHWPPILSELERLYLLESNARTITNVHLRAIPANEMGFEAVLAETRLRSEASDSEIAASIATWEWGTPLAVVSDEAQMWRFVRIHMALTWLSMAVDVPGRDKVLTDPAVSSQEVVRWFLTDWWRIGGVQFRAMYEMGT